jgi:hypothetical protein
MPKTVESIRTLKNQKNKKEKVQPSNFPSDKGPNPHLTVFPLRHLIQGHTAYA